MTENISYPACESTDEARGSMLNSDTATWRRNSALTLRKDLNAQGTITSGFIAYLARTLNTRCTTTSQTRFLSPEAHPTTTQLHGYQNVGKCSVNYLIFLMATNSSVLFDNFNHRYTLSSSSQQPLYVPISITTTTICPYQHHNHHNLSQSASQPPLCVIIIITTTTICHYIITDCYDIDTNALYTYVTGLCKRLGPLLWISAVVPRVTPGFRQ